MLQFARNEPTEESEEDLATLLRRVCDQTETYAKKQAARLASHSIAGPLQIWGSALDLEQAMLNVLRNAIESATGPVNVNISASREGDQSVVVIEDDGQGISRDDAEHVFDPFFTTRLGHGGTGLGLSVALGIVADHGVPIVIESEAGRGTRARISLPLIERAGGLG